MRVTLESRRAKARARVAAGCGTLALVLFGAARPVSAQEAGAAVQGVAAASDSGEPEDEKLAKQLANPVASLISVPFQFNYDQRLNPLGTGDRVTLNIQPVVPFALNPDWNLVSRTILPVTWSDDALVNSGRIFGTGDTLQSLFLSPAKPRNGIISGAGPVFLLPTGSSDIYSVHQWGAGPTVVVLKQTGPWTVGALANHVWSFADAGAPSPTINSTYLQPFVSYTTLDAWTFTLNSETTYDWHAKAWQVPLNAMVSKVVKIGPQRLQLRGRGAILCDKSRPGGQGLGRPLRRHFPVSEMIARAAETSETLARRRNDPMSQNGGRP